MSLKAATSQILTHLKSVSDLENSATKVSILMNMENMFLRIAEYAAYRKAERKDDVFYRNIVSQYRQLAEASARLGTVR